MGRIADGVLRNWNDGETMREFDYEQEREIIRVAVNDNYERLIKKYDKNEVDALLVALDTKLSTNITAVNTALTTHKSSADHDGRYYTEIEIDNFLSTLKGPGYSNETLRGLKQDFENLQGQINTLNNVYSTDAERIAAINNVINQFEIADDNLETLISNKADKSNTYTKAETNALLAPKANSEDVYTKGQTNSLLDQKANVSNTYTKQEVNDSLGQKADKAYVDVSLDGKADKSSSYVKSEVDNLLTGKANTVSTYTKTDVDLIKATLDTKNTQQDTRIDNILSGATVDSETIDARLGADGQVRASLGALVRDIHGKTITANRQTATLEHGLNVLNTSAATSFDPIVRGATLANVWQNALTEVGKNYVATFPNRNVGMNLGGTYTYSNTKFQGQRTVAPVLMADFVGKVSGSTVENPHIFRYSAGQATLLSPNTGIETGGGYAQAAVLDNNRYNVSATINGNCAQNLFSFNLIRHIEDNYGTIPRSTVADKVQWIKDNVQRIVCNWHGFGSSPTGNKAYLRSWNDSVQSWLQNTVKSHSNSTVSKLSHDGGFGSIPISQNIDSTGFVHFLAYADPSDGVTASTINTDYINLEVELKPYTPTSTYNDNFVGKVSGSVVENPHIAKYTSSVSLPSPSANLTEASDAYTTTRYSNLSSIDANYYRTNVGTSAGVMALQLFSFNLLELYKRKTGVTVPGANVAAQVQWLKDNITQIVANWHGFGSSVGGNKATFSIWNVTASGYNTLGANTTSSVLKVSSAKTDLADRVDANGFAHFLAYADASDGVVASTINTDFIDLDVTFKNTFRNTIRPTKQGAGLYEVDTTTYNLVNVDPAYTGEKLLNKFPYVDGVKSVQNPAITVQGKNLLPPFTEWNLHANATVKSAYELELKPTGVNQQSYVKIPVVSGRTYSISTLLGSDTEHRFRIRRDSPSGTLLVGLTTTIANFSFVIPSDVSEVFVVAENNNIGTGTFTFTNPQLELGDKATNHEPKNEDVLYAQTKLAGTTVKDELYRRDGQWYKLKKWEEVKLDGSRDWTMSTDFTGFKRYNVSITGLDSSEILVKHDGKTIQKSNTTVFTSPDQSKISNNVLLFSVSDVDTGFLEAQTPTANMIKGYFNGWRYTGDGTTHSWKSIVDDTNALTQTEAYVSANVAPNYTPYSLTYQLAKPVEEPVTVEGAISLHEGLNQVEVTSGVVVREKVAPKLANIGGVDRYVINYTGAITAAHNPLATKLGKLVSLNKNGQDFKKYTFNPSNTSGFGNGYFFIEKNDFDPTAEYTVSYLVLDKHLFTVNVNDVSGSYNTNLKTNVDGLTERMGDLTSQVTINTKILLDLIIWKKAMGG